MREDYKKQLLLPDTEYYKLFSFMRVGKNPTVWTRLFLVEDGPDGYNRHQILGSDLSEEDEGSKTELTLLQNSRKLINQKIVFSDEDYDKADQMMEVLNFVEYMYMVQWRPVGEERRFTQSFIHHDLLHSRSRAINFFKGKISSGHECWLSLTKISGPFSALDLGSTITGWSR